MTGHLIAVQMAFAEVGGDGGKSRRRAYRKHRVVNANLGFGGRTAIFRQAHRQATDAHTGQGIDPVYQNFGRVPGNPRVLGRPLAPPGIGDGAKVKHDGRVIRSVMEVARREREHRLAVTRGGEADIREIDSQRNHLFSNRPDAVRELLQIERHVFSGSGFSRSHTKLESGMQAVDADPSDVASHQFLEPVVRGCPLHGEIGQGRGALEA